MFRYYPMLFKQTRSRYISWHILFLYGFGLWIALCINNMHYTTILNQKAVLLYLQNSNLSFAHISARTETKADMLQILATNFTLYKIVLMLRAALEDTYSFISVSFILILICSYEYVRGLQKWWNNVVCNVRSIVPRLTALAETHRRSILNRILQFKVIQKPKINAVLLRQKMCSNSKQENCILGKIYNINILKTEGNIVQTEIVFSSCTLYYYFNYQRLQHTFLSTCLLDQTRKSIENNPAHSHNCTQVIRLPERNMKKGIVSTSPEFKKFLANLQRSHFLYPNMLEVSMCYITRIKLIYE